MIAGNNSAYVFVRSGTLWIEQTKLAPSENSHWVTSVSVSGDTAVIGYYGHDGKPTARVYTDSVAKNNKLPAAIWLLLLKN